MYTCALSIFFARRCINKHTHTHTCIHTQAHTHMEIETHTHTVSLSFYLYPSLSIPLSLILTLLLPLSFPLSLSLLLILAHSYSYFLSPLFNTHTLSPTPSEPLTCWPAKLLNANTAIKAVNDGSGEQAPTNNNPTARNTPTYYEIKRKNC